MNSVSREIDGRSIAAEVRMERQKHKGPFILLEGSSDARRFEPFIDERACSIVIAHGKQNVVDAIEILYDEGFIKCLGLIDADFDRILNKLPDHEGLIPSQFHDFDLDAVNSRAFERYIREVSDPQKIASFGGPRTFLSMILMRIKPLTAMRFANVKHKLGYTLNNVKLEEFFDGQSLDLDKMIDQVSWGAFSTAEAKQILKAHVDRYLASNIDLFQATCGHDVCAALGIMLRDAVGHRHKPQTWQSEIELHFRLTYQQEHFNETEPCRQLRAWANDNSCIHIFRLRN